MTIRVVVAAARVVVGIGLTIRKVRPRVGFVGWFGRAGLPGGVCEAGPNEGRGWTVWAVVPRLGVMA